MAPMIVSGVRISHPERPVYPALGFTKLDLARYYERVGPWMLPYLARRPLTFVRCERGVTRADGLRTECRFLRHTRPGIAGQGWRCSGFRSRKKEGRGVPEPPQRSSAPAS
jgi:DNA primase